MVLYSPDWTIIGFSFILLAVNPFRHSTLIEHGLYCLNVNTFAKGSAQNGLAYLRFEPCIKLTHIFTVLPAKSDSCVMFCLQSYQGVIIDISLVY